MTPSGGRKSVGETPQTESILCLQASRKTEEKEPEKVEEKPKEEEKKEEQKEEKKEEKPETPPVTQNDTPLEDIYNLD